MYALLDTKDGVWMGTDDGPLTYEDETLARMAAEHVAVKIGWPRDRVKVVTYNSPETLRRRDTIEPIKTAAEMEEYWQKQEGEARCPHGLNPHECWWCKQRRLLNTSER